MYSDDDNDYFPNVFFSCVLGDSTRVFLSIRLSAVFRAIMRTPTAVIRVQFVWRKKENITNLSMELSAGKVAPRNNRWTL